jgi:hypothetical protein
MFTEFTTFSLLPFSTMSNNSCSLALFCCSVPVPPAPMAQMLPLADSFLPFFSKLPMLNVPTNLSGLQLSFLPTALVIFYKTSIVGVLEGLFRISEHLMSVSFALLPQLLFTKLKPTAGIADVGGLEFHQPGENDK